MREQYTVTASNSFSVEQTEYVRDLNKKYGEVALHNTLPEPQPTDSKTTWLGMNELLHVPEFIDDHPFDFNLATFGYVASLGILLGEGFEIASLGHLSGAVPIYKSWKIVNDGCEISHFHPGKDERTTHDPFDILEYINERVDVELPTEPPREQRERWW